MLLHERIQQKLDEKHLRQADIARATGKSTAAVAKWLKGDNVPKTESLKQIAQLLGTTDEWLLTGKEDKQTILQKLRQKADMIQGKIDGLELVKFAMRKLPVLNEVQAGLFTGVGDDIFDDEDCEWVHGEEGDYWLRIKGDSMMPDFKQGDLLLVDMNRIAVTGNYVVAKQHDREYATFKKFRECYENGQIYYELIALNSFYPVIDSRINPFDVIGVVIQHKRVLI